MLQNLAHYGLHLFAPALIAFLFFKGNWKFAWMIMVLTMMVDLDHLFANPVFDPTRCSINFHPLHSYWAMGFYLGFLFFSKLRLVGAGLLLHMLVDGLDCLW